MNRRPLYVLIGLAVVLTGVWLLHGGTAMFSTPKDQKLLMCGNNDCGNEFKAELPVNFKNYPVKCPKCAQLNAFILTRCWKCNAAYPLDLKHPLDKCPKCGCDLPKY